jgi:riboflavin biosynthesis pyrimidine reductase
LLLERELFERGAAVAVVASLGAEAQSLAKAAGLIVIVVGEAPAGAIDLRRVATHEAVRQLERRGVLVGHEEQLTQGEGI